MKCKPGMSKLFDRFGKRNYIGDDNNGMAVFVEGSTNRIYKANPNTGNWTYTQDKPQETTDVLVMSPGRDTREYR